MKASLSRRIVRLSPVIVMSILVVLRLGGASVVRGKLQRQEANGDVAPARGIAVTVSNSQGQRSQAASTDNEGIYSIPNVRLGAYRLEVWVKPDGQPATYEIQVVDSTTDVAPIDIP